MNLTAIVKSLSLVTSLLPLIIAFIKQIEDELSAASGSVKLAAVIAAVNAYLVKIEADVDVIAATKTELSPVIAGLVALYNATGIFKKATPAPAAAAEPAPGSFVAVQ